jgi:hypothetical protein
MLFWAAACAFTADFAGGRSSVFGFLYRDAQAFRFARR